MKEKIYIAIQFALVAIAIAFFISLVSCKTQSVVLPQKQDSIRTTETIKYDSIYIDKWHTIKEKGDTIVFRDSIYITKFKYLTKHDTTIIRDSIPYKVEVIKEVRRRNGYDKFVSWGFWILFAIVAVVITLGIYLRFKR